MYQALLADVRFHQLLLNFDHDMADTARGQGCSCGGVLHSARYRRKPRGLPTGLDKNAYCWRFSFCCAVDGCRHRATPPSLRFLGGRVYLATTVVMLSAMLLTSHGSSRLCRAAAIGSSLCWTLCQRRLLKSRLV